MLWTVAIFLFFLWALGTMTSVSLGGFLPILLILAVGTVLTEVIRHPPHIHHT